MNLRIPFLFWVLLFVVLVVDGNSEIVNNVHTPDSWYVLGSPRQCISGAIDKCLIHYLTFRSNGLMVANRHIYMPTHYIHTPDNVYGFLISAQKVTDVKLNVCIEVVCVFVMSDWGWQSNPHSPGRGLLVTSADMNKTHTHTHMHSHSALLVRKK